MATSLTFPRTCCAAKRRSESTCFNPSCCSIYILGRTPVDEYIEAVEGIKLTKYAPPVK